MSKGHSIHCVSSVYIIAIAIAIFNCVIFFPASVILEQIIGTLVDKELLNIEHLEMLTTSNLRTLCFCSWFQHLTKNEFDKARYGTIEILHQTSIICPVIKLLIILSFEFHILIPEYPLQFFRNLLL